MFIQTETTANPSVIKFLPGERVTDSQSIEFLDEEAANGSPLALRLFKIGGIEKLSLGADYIEVCKADVSEWQYLKPQILGALVEHFMSGDPVFVYKADGQQSSDRLLEIVDLDCSSDLAVQVKELIDTRIRPVAEQSEGSVDFRGLKERIAYVEFTGGAFALLAGVKNMVRHYLPDVADVCDYRDVLPKPGLETPEAKAIQNLLTDNINPAVSGHGGHISLVDVREQTAYIRLEGGCQGCGMADVTLKQGVEVEIKRAVPSITSVLDVTDHADGQNPYYQPGR